MLVTLRVAKTDDKNDGIRPRFSCWPPFTLESIVTERQDWNRTASQLFHTNLFTLASTAEFLQASSQTTKLTHIQNIAKRLKPHKQQEGVAGMALFSFCKVVSLAYENCLFGTCADTHKKTKVEKTILTSAENTRVRGDWDLAKQVAIVQNAQFTQVERSFLIQTQGAKRHVQKITILCCNDRLTGPEHPAGLRNMNDLRNGINHHYLQACPYQHRFPSTIIASKMVSTMLSPYHLHGHSLV